MKIVIASDTHGKNNRLNRLEEYYRDASLYLHAGDFNDSPSRYSHWIAVQGNNDRFADAASLPLQRIVQTPFGRILLIHGHQFRPADREQKIARLAKENDCAVAVFGHTHVPLIRTVEDVLLINPGSLYRNRTGGQITYALLEWNEEGCSAGHEFYFELPVLKS